MGIFLLATAFRPALGPILPHVQWVSGLLPRGLIGRGVKLTGHLHLETRISMRGAILAFPNTSS